MTPDELRQLLERAQLSQREAARQLELDERTFRRMASGQERIPRAIALALERLADLKDRESKPSA